MPDLQEKRVIRLLISSAGRRVELINCFRSAAKELSIGLEIGTIDMNPNWSPACQVADYCYTVPRCTSPDFLERVLEISQHHHVDLIIPTIDTELMLYATNRNRFVAIGTDVLISHHESVAIARDKEKTADYLRQHGVTTPRTWTLKAVLSKEAVTPFPLILKPRGGSCSNGIAIVESWEELNALPIDNTTDILQEICQGKEYTINAFYNRDGKCVACVPHHRKTVRAGEVCFAKTVRIPAFRNIADQFGQTFRGLWGNICFQGFVDDVGNATVFEINARFGGGYPICDRAGGSFAKWILQDLSGSTPDYHDNWKEGVRMLRYDAAVFTNTD